jgi:hypothetical protein
MMTVMIRWDRAVRAHASLLLVAILLSSAQLACQRSPTGPGWATLPNGRWAGDGACLEVADA